MNNYKAIILCGGLGKRMNSEIPKALHKIFDKCIAEYVINSLMKAGINDICMVVGHKKEMVKEYFKEYTNISYAYQEQLLGTGHAVMQAKNFISYDDNILVINGDMPLISDTSIKEFIEYFESNNYSACALTAILDNPFGYGRIVRYGENLFKKIVEQKDATESEKEIKEVNLGVYLYKGCDLLSSLSKLTNNNAQGEYYITDTLYHILLDNKIVGAYTLKDNLESKNVNSREELADAAHAMFLRTNTYHMQNGVTIIDPNTTYIGQDVTIGKDTIIFPNTQIKGKTIIGENCIIECSNIENSIISDKTHITAFSNVINKQ